VKAFAGNSCHIEDNAANLDLMIYILEAFGHTTHSAHDGEEGLEKAASLRPDLIICDIQLPKADGYEVVRRLKGDSALCAIPIIAVTALAMVGDRDRVLQAGFDGYLAKPIDPELFAGQIDPWLRIRSSSAMVRVSPVTASARPPGNLATVLAVDNVPANLELTRSMLELRQSLSSDSRTGD
jgi:two-component system, cell cycle response regulator